MLVTMAQIFSKKQKQRQKNGQKGLSLKKNSEKTRAVFRKAIIVALIPTSAIKTLVNRIAIAQQPGGNAILTTKIITSNNSIEKMKKELTSPGSLTHSNNIVNVEIVQQTVAIHELPDEYFDNISSFDQFKYLPNIPAIKQAITELDDFKKKIISEIDKKITDLNCDQVANNDQIDDLNRLIYNTQDKINQLKTNLTNTLSRLNNCTNKDDVKNINEQLTTYSNELGKLINDLRKNHKITISKIMPDFRTSEIQAIKDAKRATITISYTNSNGQIFNFYIGTESEPFEECFFKTIEEIAKQYNIKKSTLLKPFLLYPGQAATGSLSRIMPESGKTIEQITDNGITQHFSFSEQGMNISTCYYYKPGSRDLESGIMSYEGYTLEEKIEMNIKPGQKVLMPTEYSISKLTENESNPEKLITFDGNDFPKLTNTNAFPENFPEYLKEPFKQLCEKINNCQQTQSDQETSE